MGRCVGDLTPLALLPDRRMGIVVLANSDAGSAPINAVVQQWMRLTTKP